MAQQPEALQFTVQDEADVVLLRQRVRQAGRSIGVGLIAQAKVSAASSSVARAVLALQLPAFFQVEALAQRREAGLEISCDVAFATAGMDQLELERRLHFNEARLLVDAAQLTVTSSAVHLTLQVWS